MLEISNADTFNEVRIGNEVVGTLGRDGRFGKMCVFGEKAKTVPQTRLTVVLEGITVGNLDDNHFILLTRKDGYNVSFPVRGNFKPETKIRVSGGLVPDDDYEMSIIPSLVKEIA